MARIPRRSPRAAELTTHDEAHDVAVGDPVALFVIIERFAERARKLAALLESSYYVDDQADERMALIVYRLAKAVAAARELRMELSAGKETP